MGIPLDQWPRNLRHVREFWNNGEVVMGQKIELSEVEPGSILIFEKKIPINGLHTNQPCHMALVTGRSDTSELRVIHTSLKTRTVCEEVLSPLLQSRIVGAISINAAFV